VRLNLEISQQVRDRIDRIRVLTEADTTTEVIRRALSVYEALLGATGLTMRGRLVLKMEDGTERDLLLMR
jgi:hypothetical protein